MNGIGCQLVVGKNLSREDLAIINQHRRIEFQSSVDITPAPYNEDWETPYFLVRDKDGNLLSFGRLLFLEVIFCGTTYPILGIATILSIDKGKGYGRLLMENMKSYIKSRKVTAIGFCDPEDTLFYEKCGLGALRDSTGRFVFPGGPKSAQSGDIIYFAGEDGLIWKMLAYPGEKVLALQPEW